LNFLHNLLLELAEKYGWRLEAWAIFANHYHFIANSPEDPSNLNKFITHLHANSARELNRLHGTPGRQVWFQFWESHISYQASYLARLNYVITNPVKHKFVNIAENYPWCSAAWFKANSRKSYYETVMRMKTDQLEIIDDF